MVVRRYVVVNRVTKEAVTVLAESFQEACQALGWMVGDCWCMSNVAIGVAPDCYRTGVGEHGI